MKSTVEKGAAGEECAAEYISRKGFDILARNFRCRRGEIDIIAKDGGTTVFIEVKTRTNGSYGFAREAVTPEKQRRIRSCAETWLCANAKGEWPPCRFDVIEVEYMGGAPCVSHWRDAF